MCLERVHSRKTKIYQDWMGTPVTTCIRDAQTAGTQVIQQVMLHMANGLLLC